MKIKNLVLVIIAFISLSGVSFGQTLPADLDSSFGNSGIVANPTGNAKSIADTGYEFVAVGGANIVKYGYNGAILGQTSTLLPNGNYFQAEAVAIQTDPITRQQKLVVAGYVFTSAGNITADLIVARYDSNLQLDPTFLNGGFIQYQAANLKTIFPDDLTIQQDGKIVVVGQAGDYTNSPMQQFVARFEANGKRDGRFGGGTGAVVTKIGNASNGHSVVQIGSDLFVGGGSIGKSNIKNSIVTRYDNSGNLNPQFSKSGILNLGSGNDASIVPFFNGLTVAGVSNGIV
jgi:hypothetical protein